MAASDIKKLLDKISEYRVQMDSVLLEKQKLVDEAMGEEVKKRIADITAEFAGKAEAVDKNLAALEQQIKDAVVEEGETVDGVLYQAVFNKGRVTWDTGILDGLAIAIPELNQARKQGEPFVVVKRKKV